MVLADCSLLKIRDSQTIYPLEIEADGWVHVHE
jgi:hypothetical protein